MVNYLQMLRRKRRGNPRIGNILMINDSANCSSDLSLLATSERLKTLMAFTKQTEFLNGVLTLANHAILAALPLHLWKAEAASTAIPSKAALTVAVENQRLSLSPHYFAAKARYLDSGDHLRNNHTGQWPKLVNN